MSLPKFQKLRIHKLGKNVEMLFSLFKCFNSLKELSIDRISERLSGDQIKSLQLIFSEQLQQFENIKFPFQT
jgi:hypothetical protein